MSVKNWKEYLNVNEETTPVQTDNAVEQELTQRSTDLEAIKTQITQITAAAAGIASMTEAEAVTASVEEKISSFSNNKDSFVTLALSYLKTMGDKKVIELKLQKYQEEIPALQTEIKGKLDQLNSELDEMHQNASEPPSA